MWTHGCIGDVLSLIQNGVNCKQDKSGVGDKVSRIETIADSNINYDKTGFAVLDEKQKAKAILHKGDILFSHINSPVHVGKTAIYDGVEPLYHGINLLRLQTIDAVDSRYFNMFLMSLFQSGYWKRTSKQSVNQASVNQTDIKQVPFSYPPLAEQQRIVAKLDAAFAEIDRAIAIIHTKKVDVEILKSALLRVFLTDDATMWRTDKLGDICSVITKGTTPTSVGFNFQADGINFIKIESIDQNGNFIKSKFAKISEDCHTSLKRSQLMEGDILFSIAGALGRTSIVTREILPANTNQAIAILRIKSEVEIDRKYLLYVLNSEATKEQSNANMGGVAQLNLSLSQLKTYSVSLPPLAEQQRIVAKLDAAFTSMEKFAALTAASEERYSSLKSAILAQELNPSEAE